MYIAGTRYKQTNQPAVLSHSIRWKAVRGLGFTALISLATNAIDFTFGENKDKGVVSNEFAASTMVDFAQAGLIGVGSAVLVGGIFTTFAISAPLWVPALIATGVGIGAGLLFDHFVDTDILKQKVANGFSAFGGIFQNSITIAKVGAQRLGERVSERVRDVKDAVFETIQNVGDSIKTGSKNISEAAQDVKEKVGSILSNLFGASG